jgi:hypothetical protein
MQRFILTQGAQKDLDDIWFYIAKESGSITPAETGNLASAQGDRDVGD